MLAELFLFSEQCELDVDKLTHKLGEISDSAQVSAVSVLLMLTGSSSYLWLDPEHHPKNVKLCAMLKHHFPNSLKFVICPTSKATQDAWEAQSSKPRNIFGSFWDNNMSVWDGFDRDADSNCQIFDLTWKEGKGSEDKLAWADRQDILPILPKQPENTKASTWWLAFGCGFGCGVAAALLIYKLWKDPKAIEATNITLELLETKVSGLEAKQTGFAAYEAVCDLVRRAWSYLNHKDFLPESFAFCQQTDGRLCDFSDSAVHAKAVG